MTIRAPLYTRVGPAKGNRPEAVVTQNLLLSTLQGQAAAPVASYDFPNPRLVIRQQDFVAPNLLLTTLGITQAPFALYDWPQPPAAKVTRVRDAINLLPITAVAVPFAQYDWPQPQVVKPIRVRDAVNQLLTTLAPTGAPFAMSDWPVPIRAVFRPVVDVPNLLQGTLTPAAATPFALYDWPYPSYNRRNSRELDVSSLLTVILTPPEVVIPPDVPVQLPGAGKGKNGKYWPRRIFIEDAPYLVESPEALEELLTSFIEEEAEAPAKTKKRARKKAQAKQIEIRYPEFPKFSRVYFRAKQADPFLQAAMQAAMHRYLQDQEDGEALMMLFH